MISLFKCFNNLQRSIIGISFRVVAINGIHSEKRRPPFTISIPVSIFKRQLLSIEYQNLSEQRGGERTSSSFCASPRVISTVQRVKSVHEGVDQGRMLERVGCDIYCLHSFPPATIDGVGNACRKVS